MEPFTAFALLVVSSLLIQAFSPRQRQNSVDPQSFDTSSLPVPDEGTRIIEVFGDVNIENWMVLGYGDQRTRPIKGGDIADSGKK